MCSIEEKKMKNINLVLCLCLLHFCTTAQINLDLKNKLDSIQKIDQHFREEVHLIMTDKKYSDSLSRTEGFVMSEYVKDIMLNQEINDRKNINFIDSIIKIYGYPGLSLVGESTCQTAWNIIQHSYEIDNYYRLIHKASKRGEIPDSLFAKTQDRFLINRGKKQIYGTQADCMPNVSGSFNCILSPIRNSQKVNKRRKKVGFLETVEEYAKNNGYQLNN